MLQLVIVLIDYGVRAAIEGQSFDLPLMQIATDLLYSLTAISLALLLTILMVSASVGIVLTLVYLCVLEMIIFPLLGTLSGMLDKPAVATALGYSPMKLPERLVNSAIAENSAGAILVLVAAVLIPVLAGWLSYFRTESPADRPDPLILRRTAEKALPLHKSPAKYLQVRIVLALLIILAGSSCARSGPVPEKKAIAGHIDLSQHDFNQSPVIVLGGEWDLFRNRLIGTLAEAQSISAERVVLPQTWSGNGHATYRLKIRLCRKPA